MRSIKFEDLEFSRHWSGGIQALAFFANGYGVSVVQFYGRTDGYEVAVLRGTKKRWSIATDTIVPYGVVHGLDEDQVETAVNLVSQYTKEVA